LALLKSTLLTESAFAGAVIETAAMRAIVVPLMVAKLALLNLINLVQVAFSGNTQNMDDYVTTTELEWRCFNNFLITYSKAQIFWIYPCQKRKNRGLP
jgi:hypothetical protein